MEELISKCQIIKSENQGLKTVVDAKNEERS